MRIDVPDYLKLFIRREGKIVLGRNFSNVWLLTAMLVASFFAIAFANGSLNYLGYKMDDPFIKWVDIKEDRSDPKALKEALQSIGTTTNTATISSAPGTICIRTCVAASSTPATRSS